MGMTRKFAKGSMLSAMASGCLCVYLLLFAVAARAQAPLEVDPAVAQKLGEAAEKSNAAAYVLGFVCILSLGLTGWAINKWDQSNAKIDRLSDEIAAQTKAYQANSLEANKALQENVRRLADAAEAQAKQPCALDHETLGQLIKGKFSK